jgi:hypothetical protein
MFSIFQTDIPTEKSTLGSGVHKMNISEQILNK